MDYKNDNRTPRDRITGEFLSDILFYEQECDCNRVSVPAGAVSAGKNQCTVRKNARDGGVEFAGNFSLAMAYVPMQKFGELFDIDTGFCNGTIFKELRFPFYPTPCRKESN